MGSSRGEGRLDPQVKRHVDDLFPRLDELFAAAEAIEQLTAQFGWTVLQRLVEFEVETVNRELDRGGEPLSRSAYAKAHGRRGGLRFLTEAADAIVQRAAQREAEQRAKHEGAGETAPEGALA